MTKSILVATITLLLAACGNTDSGPAFLLQAPDPQEAALRQAMADGGMGTLTQPAPESSAMVDLGRMLFFDKELSGNRNISCATCHHPAAATGDALPVSIGEGGVGLAENRVQALGHLIPRNAPHVFNLGVPEMHKMFWDGRVTREPGTGILDTPEAGLNGPSPAPQWAPYVAQLTTALAAQAMFPVTSREEMRGDGSELATAGSNQVLWERLMARLVGTDNGTTGGIPEYRQLFQAAFPSVTDFDDLTFAHAARAIAAFETHAYTKLDSPFDDYIAGDASALSDRAKRGAELFCGRAQCINCHSGPNLSDLEHYSIAAPQVGPGKDGPFEDRGRFLVTNDTADLYKFRTPPLRNVALTGPWTHAGAYMTLESVVRHHLDPTSGLLGYDATQLPALFEPTLDTDVPRNNARLASVSPELGSPIALTDAEIADLLAFLQALTSPSSLSLLHDIPDSVPSGLPVTD